MPETEPTTNCPDCGEFLWDGQRWLDLCPACGWPAHPRPESEGDNLESRNPDEAWMYNFKPWDADEDNDEVQEEP